MLNLLLLKQALLFLFGAPNKVLYTAITFTVVNIVLDLFRKYEPPKKKKQLLYEILKRLLAYIAFIIIAARIDTLEVSAIFGWEGSTQLPVCFYIMAREIRMIFSFIREQGIDIPAALDSRVNTIERSTQSSQSDSMNTISTNEVDPESIDRKIEAIKAQLAQVEALRNDENNSNNGGGTV